MHWLASSNVKNCGKMSPAIQSMGIKKARIQTGAAVAVCRVFNPDLHNKKPTTHLEDELNQRIVYRWFRRLNGEQRRAVGRWVSGREARNEGHTPSHR